MLHQLDGRVDIGRLVVNLGQDQVLGNQKVLVSLGHRRANFLHHRDDIGAGLPIDRERQGRLSHHPDFRDGCLVVEDHVGDISHRHPGNAPGHLVLDRPQHNLADRLAGNEVALCADHVTPLALVHGTGGYRGIGAAQGGHDLGDRKAILRQTLRVDHDLHFAFGPAIDPHLGDTVYALQPVLDDVLGEIKIGMDQPLIVAGTAQDKPGDRLVLGARRIKRRLVNLGRIATHPVQSVGDQQQGFVHVLADTEFQRDPGAAGLGLADNRFQSLDTA